jgi:hypothetical protein
LLEINRLSHNQALAKLLVCIFVFSSCVIPFALAADNQSANLPTRTLGDEWRFIVDYKGNEGILFNLTTTVTQTTTQNPSTNNECFELTSVGSGIVYGTNVSGSAAFTFKEYYLKSNYSLAEISQNKTVTTDIAGVTNRSSSTTNTLYSPAFGINGGFPLSTGKTWTANSTATSTTNIDTDGQFSQENSTGQAVMNFVVDRAENTTTIAGVFETYVIIGTASDGSVQEIYYAPNVGMQVKETDYDGIGNIVATMELQSYSLAGSTELPVYWIALAGAGVAVAVGAVGFVALRQAKTKKAISG